MPHLEVGSLGWRRLHQKQRTGLTVRDRLVKMSHHGFRSLDDESFWCLCTEPGLRADFRCIPELDHVLSVAWEGRRSWHLCSPDFCHPAARLQGWGWASVVHWQGEGVTLGLWLWLLTVKLTCCPRVTRQQTTDTHGHWRHRGTHMGIGVRQMMGTQTQASCCGSA